MIKKIFIFITVLVLSVCAFAFGNTKIKAVPLTTSNKIVVRGASVRTTGNAGIKFDAVVGDYDTTNVTAYGIAIAYGSVSVSDDFKVGGTIGGKAVLSTTVDELDGTNEFHIVLYNVPNTAYVQDVTARAFVIDNGEYVYGEAVAVRNLAEVSLKALNDGETGDLLTTVASYIGSNYKKGYENYAGNYVLNSALYCYDPIELGQLFAADWNKFVDASDSITSMTSNTKATSAGLYYKARTGADFYYSAKGAKWTDVGSQGQETGVTDISSSNLYMFFKDAYYGAKWDWILKLIIAADGTVHGRRQAEAIIGNGIDVIGNGTHKDGPLFNGSHLIGSIISFFNESKITFYYQSNNFGTGSGSKRSYYENMYTGSYANTTVYNSFLREHILCKVGENTSLPSAKTPSVGYVWDGYYLGEVKYNDLGTYSVTSSNVTFEPRFTLQSYSITYHNLEGASNGVGNPDEYNIESDTIDLANPSKVNYEFAGWYDNALFTGDAITSIPTGSTGDKNIYAKFVLCLYVNYSWSVYSNGDEVSYLTNTLIKGTTAFHKIEDALAAVEEGGTIKVLPGTYSYASGYSMSKNGVKLLGANYETSATDEGRLATGNAGEAIINDTVITLGYAMSSIQIKGFKFTGVSQIVNTKGSDSGSVASNLNGFEFSYNIVECGLASGEGFVYFQEAANRYSHDLVFAHNSFTHAMGKVTTNMVQLDNLYNLNFHHNTMVNVNGRGLYVNDKTKGASGENVLICDNIFNNISGNAIHLNWVSFLPADSTVAVIEVNGNRFNNVRGVGVVIGPCNNSGDQYNHVQVNNNIFTGDVYLPVLIDRVRKANAYFVTGNEFNCTLGSVTITLNGNEVTYTNKYVANGNHATTNRVIDARNNTYNVTPEATNFTTNVTYE